MQSATPASLFEAKTASTSALTASAALPTAALRPAQRSIWRSFVLSPMATKRVSGISQRRESSSSAVPLLVPPGRISM